jgi:hypothetical protein
MKMSTKMLIPLRALAVSACVCIWGCAHVTNTSDGRDFETSEVRGIVKGKTTANEIIAKFGEPYAKRPSAGGGEVWTYYYQTTSVKDQGLTPGGALAGILIPGTVGTEVAAMNAAPSKTVHKKTLTVIFSKERIVVDDMLERK